MIEAGADVNRQDSTGRTALMWASREGHLESVNVLLVARANVNTRDSNGRTALYYAKREASKIPYIEIIRVLKAAGATE